MKYDWIDGYCLTKTGTVRDYKVEWDATRYLVGDKMYVMMGTNKEKKPIITVKCEPIFGQSLRDQYPDIIPGYYMNKTHWNSVFLAGDVPDEILKTMLDMSYDLIFKALTQKQQKNILTTN